MHLGRSSQAANKKFQKPLERTAAALKWGFSVTKSPPRRPLPTPCPARSGLRQALEDL